MISSALHPPPPTDLASPPTTPVLFRDFMLLGLTGFGGVLPMTRTMLVQRKRWMSDAEFADILGLCQFLPGGNALNLAVAVGLRFRGVAGGIAAFAGLMAAPTLSVILLGLIYARFADNLLVRHLFAGVAAAAAGLLVSLGIRLFLQLQRDWLKIGLGILTMLAIARLRMPLLPTMLVMAPVSILLLARQRTR